MDDVTAWQAYVDYLRAQAHRSALKQAILSEKPAPTLTYRHIEGQGGVTLVLIPTPNQVPWSEEMLARYVALADGGEWVF